MWTILTEKNVNNYENSFAVTLLQLSYLHTYITKVCYVQSQYRYCRISPAALNA